MKSKRPILILLAAAAIIVAALAFRHFRVAGKTNPPVAIQDGKTIDFSSGKPVVKDSAKEKAVIDAAVKEMDEAVKDMTITSPPAPPAERKTGVTAPEQT